MMSLVMVGNMDIYTATRCIDYGITAASCPDQPISDSKNTQNPEETHFDCAQCSVDAWVERSRNPHHGKVVSRNHLSRLSRSSMDQLAHQGSYQNQGGSENSA
jgi:hypothetical protein